MTSLERQSAGTQFFGGGREHGAPLPVAGDNDDTVFSLRICRIMLVSAERGFCPAEVVPGKRIKAVVNRLSTIGAIGAKDRLAKMEFEIQK
jgi:hypothetical protein